MLKLMDPTEDDFKLQSSSTSLEKKKGANKRQFICNHCSLPFASKFSMKRHMAICQSKKKTWKCIYNECNLFFFKAAALRTHLSLAHDKKFSEIPSFKIQCDICSRYFSARKILNHHRKTCKKSDNISKRKWSCYVDQCDLKFHKAVDLKYHLSNAHKITIGSEKLNFQSYDDFLIWKEKEEEATFSYFPKSNKIVKKDNVLYERFICQKHGSSKAHKNQNLIKNIRKNKKGRSKTNETCIAQMIVTSFEDGITKVDYINSHFHPLALENVVHHPTPKSIRDQATDLLSRGTCPESVQKTLIEGRLKDGGKGLFKLKNIKYLQDKLKRSEGRAKPVDDISEALADINVEINSYLQEDCENILGPILFDEKEIERSEVTVKLDKIDQYLEKIVCLRNSMTVDTKVEIVEFVESSLSKVKSNMETMVNKDVAVKRLPAFQTLISIA